MKTFKYIVVFAAFILAITPFMRVSAQQPYLVEGLEAIFNASESIPSVPTSDLAQSAKETRLCFIVCLPFGMDSLALGIAKHSLEMIVDSTVNWINTGFDGNPAYVTNPGQYFTDIADGVAGEFIQGSDLGFLCSPFQANIRLSLAKQYYKAQPFQCTLSEVGGNIEAFYSDFSQGGWDTWFSMTQNENNNPYGAYINAKIELDSRIASAVGLKNQQLDWGRGFLSKETCLKNDAGIEIRDLGTGKCKAPGPIITPGAAIEGQLQKVLGTGVTQLELADEFDELIGALLGQFLEKSVFGIQGLFGAESVDDTGSNAIDPTNNDPQTPAEFFNGYCIGWGLDCSIFSESGDKIFYMFTSPTTVIFYPQITSVSPEGIEDVVHLELDGVEVKLCEADSAAYKQGCQYFKNFGTNGNGSHTFYGYLVDRTLRTKPTLPDPNDPNSNPGTSSQVISEELIVIGNGSIIVPKERGTIGIIGGVEVPPGSATPTLPPGTEPANLLSDLKAERNKYPDSFKSLCTSLNELQPDTCPLGKILNAVAWKNKNSGWVLLGKDSGNRCKIPSGETVSCDFLLHEPTLYGYDVFIGSENQAEPTWRGPDPDVPGLIRDGSRTIVKPVAP
ncbi:MAG: hypothetical protein NUV78_00500 [Candidatus Zambryskibacteria bacterium]|nr:hypothetical protein [Candidatus Zambryskibacteria bacterium]